jgi:hypothetical protein
MGEFLESIPSHPVEHQEWSKHFRGGHFETFNNLNSQKWKKHVVFKQYTQNVPTHIPSYPINKLSIWGLIQMHGSNSTPCPNSPMFLHLGPRGLKAFYAMIISPSSTDWVLSLSTTINSYWPL